jgi:ribosome-associated protein
LTIIEDTRQQIDKHKIENAQLEKLGIKILRSKLPVGDYANMKNLSIVIDSKKDLQECVGNICGKEHDRFRRECQLAQDNGIKLIVLVEHGWGVKSIDDVALWHNPRINAWNRSVKAMQRKCQSTAGMRPPTSGETLSKAMKTMQDKYGVEFMFCSRGDAGKRIVDILGGE